MGIENNYDLFFTRAAEQDLQRIFEYISVELSAENAAQSLMKKIEKQIFLLKDFPFRCPLIADKRLARADCRRLVIDNFVAVYYVNTSESKVVIIGVFYGRQNYLGTVTDRT